MMAFQSQAFEEACRDLTEFSDEGWEKITECHGFTFYKRGAQNSGLFEYKGIGTFPDVTPDICAKSLTDIEYWKTWDENVKALEDREVLGQTYMYWRCLYPTPLSDRDYVLVKEDRTLEKAGQTVWVTLLKSAPPGTIPTVPGVVRVDDYWDNTALTSDGETGTKLCVRSYDDPTGYIPNFIINWFVKTALPDYLEKLHKSCVDYPTYIAEKR